MGEDHTEAIIGIVLGLPSAGTTVRLFVITHSVTDLVLVLVDPIHLLHARWTDPFLHLRTFVYALTDTVPLLQVQDLDLSVVTENSMVDVRIAENLSVAEVEALIEADFRVEVDSDMLVGIVGKEGFSGAVDHLDLEGMGEDLTVTATAMNTSVMIVPGVLHRPWAMIVQDDPRRLEGMIAQDVLHPR